MIRFILSTKEMSNYILIYVLCVTAVRSFPLQEIGKNALVLKRVARQNYIVQPNLVSTQFYKASNISALLNAFYENYHESNEGKGKNVFKNDEGHESYIEDENNFGSEDRNTDENDVKASNYGNIENTRESEEDEEELKSTAEKDNSENINDKNESNSIDSSDKQHYDVTASINNYLNSNKQNEFFRIEKDHNQNFNEKDTPKSIKISRNNESDENYVDFDEADYEHEVFGNDLYDDDANDDNASEDFTNEDYNINGKVNSAESDMNDKDTDDKYRTIMINELQNRNFQDNKIDSSNTINGKHEVSLMHENIDKNYFLTPSKNIELGDDWWFSASKPYKQSEKSFKFDSKFPKNRITLNGKGKWKFEDNHGVSGSAFGKQANGQWSEDGNFNYHDKPSHTNFRSSQN